MDKIKKISHFYKMLALILVFLFVFQNLNSINSHSYTTGVDNIHGHHDTYSFNCFPASYYGTHMNYECLDALFFK